MEGSRAVFHNITTFDITTFFDSGGQSRVVLHNITTFDITTFDSGGGGGPEKGDPKMLLTGMEVWSYISDHFSQASL